MQHGKDNLQNSQKPFVPNVIENIKKTLRGKPHTLQDVQISLVEDSNVEIDFVQLLEKHHGFLKESIAVLTDARADWQDKQWHLDRFLHLLNMHAKAEQETLYRSMEEAVSENVRLESFACQDEHDIADQLAQELQAMKFDSEWSEEIEAKAKVLASLVLSHVKEEESTVFPDVKKNLDMMDLQSLAPDYLKKCQVYIDL